MDERLQERLIDLVEELVAEERIQGPDRILVLVQRRRFQISSSLLDEVDDCLFPARLTKSV